MECIKILSSELYSLQIKPDDTDEERKIKILKYAQKVKNSAMESYDHYHFEVPISKFLLKTFLNTIKEEIITIRNEHQKGKQKSITELICLTESVLSNLLPNQFDEAEVKTLTDLMYTVQISIITNHYSLALKDLMEYSID